MHFESYWCEEFKDKIYSNSDSWNGKGGKQLGMEAHSHGIPNTALNCPKFKLYMQRQNLSKPPKLVDYSAFYKHGVKHSVFLTS